MIVRSGLSNKYPPIFRRFEEQFDYTILPACHFNEFVADIQDDISGRYSVLEVDGWFTIVFSKVLDK